MSSPIFPSLIFWNKYNKDEKKILLSRPKINFSTKIHDEIKNIFNKVRKNGDSILHELNARFDNIITYELRITEKEIIKASDKISKRVKHAMNVAKKNITNFHHAQQSPEINIETFPGVRCQQIIRPLHSVGLYIPGGLAPLPSTVLMMAIPANIAGCKRIILCSPPPISDEILYAAKLCNVHEVYQVGGGQAIAAMGFGTESIVKVDKIFGPGNVWVTEAKRQIHSKINGIAIDMLAGPSELLIIADNNANPIFIAADMLSQAEHGPDSQVILLTPEEKIGEQVQYEIKKQIKTLSRADVIEKALTESKIIITNNIMDCINISNYYAPEHLSIQTKNAQSWIKYIINAGSIFLGNWSPESAGDYASGTNHVLPTYGFAYTYSGLGLIDFQKRITIQQLNQNGLLKLAPIIETLAESEKFTAHKNAVTLRVIALKAQ